VTRIILAFIAVVCAALAVAVLYLWRATRAKPCGGLTHDVAGRHKARRTVRYIDTRADELYVARRFDDIAKRMPDVARDGRALIEETR
jgi:hypothetical protein